MSTTTTVKLSGNDVSWLTAVAERIMDAGDKPASVALLLRVIPPTIGTAHNDGHVTAAANGLDRDDYKAGWRLWVIEAVGALRRAKLIDGPDDALRWAAPADGEWRVRFGAGNRRVLIRGRAQRDRARDLHMLGERSEKDGVVRTGLLLEGRSQPLKVNVRRGIANVIEKGENALEVHPLALAIPPMTPAEQEAIRADIERHGVKVPLILYPDKDDVTPRGKPKVKILDGRHRGYFASVTGQTVDVEVFEGTDEEARAHVASLNLIRRQLTAAQKATAAAILFGQQARDEAEEAKKAAALRGNKSRSPVRAELPEPGEDQNGAGTWYERAAEMAGGKAAGVTGAAVKHAATIVKAPETLAKVQAGEEGYTKTATAVRKAEIELGRRAPDEPVAPADKVRTAPEKATISNELRRAERALLNILEEQLEPREPGRIAGQIAELKRLLPLVEDRARELGLL